MNFNFTGRARELYSHRKLSECYPDLSTLSYNYFKPTLEAAAPDRACFIERLLMYFDRLVNIHKMKHIAVLGCGPVPQTVKILIEKNFAVVGIEPIPRYVKSASEYIGDKGSIMLGCAEEIPLPDHSQDLLFCESVLEHVDSVSKSLSEMFRVLSPGGIAYISTTNKFHFSITGRNGEFNVRYFNWFPQFIKESIVFHHLHYNPRLANYSENPAVHWYSFAELCQLGRNAGFSQFYSLLDLLDADDPSVNKSGIRKFLLNKLKYNPFLRSLALTQIGNTIVMYKKTV